MAGLTLDGAAVGLHRGAAQLWRGSLSSVLKLACVGVLVLVSTRTSAGLIFAWALALIVAFIVCMPMLGLQRTPPGEGALSHRVALVRRFTTLSLQHHVLNLSISSVSFIVPLTATLLISPSQVAYFSAAYLLASTMLIIPYLLALSLFAERSGDPGLLHRHVRRTLPFALALIGAIVLVVEIAAPYALRIFGPAYAANGTTALRILILVGPAYVIKDHYVSICRAQQPDGPRLQDHGNRDLGRRSRGRPWAGLCGVSRGSASDGRSPPRARPSSCSPPSSSVYRHAPALESDRGSESD